MANDTTTTTPCQDASQQQPPSETAVNGVSFEESNQARFERGELPSLGNVTYAGDPANGDVVVTGAYTQIDMNREEFSRDSIGDAYRRGDEVLDRAQDRLMSGNITGALSTIWNGRNDVAANLAMEAIAGERESGAADLPQTIRHRQR